MQKLGIKKINDIFYFFFVLLIGIFTFFNFFLTFYQLATKHLLYKQIFQIISHFYLFKSNFLLIHNFYNPIIYIIIFCTLLIYIPMFLWIFFGIIKIFYKPYKLKNKLKNNTTTNTNPHEKMISVIIPAYNEEKVIKNILSDLLSQNYKNFEIIVVAHNCTDNTVKKAKEIINQKIKVIEYNTEKIGKALALNKGLNEAKGELIAQFDADNRIKDLDFLKKAASYFEDININGIQSEVVASNPNSSFVSFMVDLEYEIFKEISYYGRAALGLNCILAGTGVILRKKDLLEIGGWNNYLVEDFELSTRYSLKKKRIIFASDIKVYDEKPTTWYEMIRQRKRWIKGYLQVFLKNITNFGNIIDYIYRLSPLSIFAWWFSTLFFLIYFFTNNNLFKIFKFINFLWIIITFSFIILIIYILIKLKKYNWKKILYFCFLYWIFEFHWLWVGLASLTVSNWRDTKTIHNGDFYLIQGVKIEK